MARILVADDEAPIREMIKIACELDGHEVHDVMDAEDALAAYDTFRPDLMILDINMPGGGGDHIIEQLRARGARPCPWIVVTGLAGALTEEEIEELNAAQVLSKPFSIDGLRLAVGMALAGAG
jgi:CheY-like chemotaxis protein